MSPAKSKGPAPFLLDVNVLIALVDSAHVQHDAAHDWFHRLGNKAWATCPITESGLLRIVGHPRYPNSPGTPAAVAELLVGLRALPGHAFWPDDISVLDPRIDATRLLHSSQVTDSYLLALAQSHGGQLATFDRRLVVDAVRRGAQALCLLLTLTRTSMALPHRDQDGPDCHRLGLMPRCRD